MATVSKEFAGENHYYALEPHCQRGGYFGGISNDGKQVIIYWGSELGYPVGESVLSVNRDQIPDLIACLRATLQLKG